MSDLVGGAAPVRSLIKVGEGVANLILLPIEQYQKDGRVVKGLQRGGKSFAKTTTLEAIKITSRLATGTQVILEKAEAALRGGSTVPVEVIENDGDVRQSQSRYANQPSSAREGFTQAYSALAHDLGSAAQTILAIPMEVHENAGSGEVRSRQSEQASLLIVDSCFFSRSGHWQNGHSGRTSCSCADDDGFDQRESQDTSGHPESARFTSTATVAGKVQVERHTKRLYHHDL